jgi:hypothetical protein
MSTGASDLGEPEHGVRLIARLTNASESRASYELSVALPGVVHEGRVEFAEDGELSFEWSSAGPPPAAVDPMTRALLRSAFHRRRAGEPWPRRLTRWRPDPHGPAEDPG